MNLREVAWRVFAEEYNSSLLEHRGEGEKPVSYVITPLGAKVNRMLVVGVVTDVEDVGEEGRPRYRARVTDPTGTFYISAGEYQPAAAMALSKISPPAFAAVVGKSRAYSPEEGVKYLSIRPERIREVEAEARDYWVLEAAKSTLVRIDAIEEGLAMAQPTVAELMRLGYPEPLADGVLRAIEHYKDIDVDRFRNMIRDALRSILPESKAERAAEKRAPPKKAKAPAVKVEEETKEEELHEGMVGADEEDTVLKMIDALDTSGRGAKWDKMVEAANAKKIDKVRLEEVVASLLDKGEIYEPELGMMKRI
ncbi:MAG: RPA family protein [Thermoplasmata archaeon]